jgi:hypothetical protein
VRTSQKTKASGPCSRSENYVAVFLSGRRTTGRQRSRILLALQANVDPRNRPFSFVRYFFRLHSWPGRKLGRQSWAPRATPLCHRQRAAIPDGSKFTGPVSATHLPGTSGRADLRLSPHFETELVEIARQNCPQFHLRNTNLCCTPLMGLLADPTVDVAQLGAEAEEGDGMSSDRPG